MVFLCSHLTSFIDLSIHLILNSEIVLECRCFVLTSRISFGTYSLEAKSLEVTRVSIVIVLSPKPISYFKRLI